MAVLLSTTYLEVTRGYHGNTPIDDTSRLDALERDIFLSHSPLDVGVEIVVHFEALPEEGTRRRGEIAFAINYEFEASGDF